MFCALCHSNFFLKITIKSLIYDLFRNRVKGVFFGFLLTSLIFPCVFCYLFLWLFSSMGRPSGVCNQTKTIVWLSPEGTSCVSATASSPSCSPPVCQPSPSRFASPIAPNRPYDLVRPPRASTLSSRESTTTGRGLPARRSAKSCRNTTTSRLLF